jgi:pimeloyl-ACP methyl ester carboxylesterase
MASAGPLAELGRKGERTLARVICVHGIGQQSLGEQSLLATWHPALVDGLVRAGHVAVPEVDVAMGFYGHLYRPSGALLALGDPVHGAADVRPGIEQDLLTAWWTCAAAIEKQIAPPNGNALVRVSQSVQTALRQLSKSKFFAGVALRAMVPDLKQVARYLTDPDLRVAVRKQVANLITEDTRVVVGHSLGSVVAYEMLCALPSHGVRALVTLGLPLGIPNLVFDRLHPVPVEGRGVWPGGPDLVWTNIVDGGDVVALEKDLRGRFGSNVRNVLVHNGAHAHSVIPYLSDGFTGAAIAAGLR